MKSLTNLFVNDFFFLFQTLFVKIIIVGDRMIRIIVIVYLLSIYISIPGLIGKANYNWLLGWIPFVNIYYLLSVLEIKPIFLIIISLLLIFLPDRALIVTMMVVFLPFLIADCYENNVGYGFLGLILPFIVFPYIAYFHGEYLYSEESL
mgnify:CR=1 FL=1